MGSKGGGGSVDTSGLEKATREATALQKQIYEQTRGDVQPWYGAGVGGINKLSDLLGLSGGSVQSRDQIYDELLPQYTTAQESPLDMWKGYGGALFGDERRAQESFIDPETGTYRRYVSGDVDDIGLKSYGMADVSPYTSSTSKDVTDFEALNAAIDERLATQGTPEGYGSLLEDFDYSTFEKDPGYEFRKQEAQKALERSLAAQGATLGGGGYGSINPRVARALEEQSQGLASQEYASAFDRYNIENQNVYNRLMGIAGMGQGTTGQLAGAGQNYATNVGNLQTGLAQAQLNAQLSNQQNDSSMFSNLLGLGAQAAGTYFSDVRLKENIKLVDIKNRHNIYEFDYLDGSGRFRGVLAHEVEKLEPEAVTEHPSGYLMVDYDKIDVEMERV